MSLIKLTGINDIVEQPMAPAALYDLVCVKVMEKTKEGKTNFNLLFSIENEEIDYQNLFDFMSLPQEGDDEDAVKFKLLLIKRRLTALGMVDALEDEAFDPADMVGQRSEEPIQIAVQEPNEDNKWKEGRNIVWPNLPTEED